MNRCTGYALPTRVLHLCGASSRTSLKLVPVFSSEIPEEYVFGFASSIHEHITALGHFLVLLSVSRGTTLRSQACLFVRLAAVLALL